MVGNTLWPMVEIWLFGFVIVWRVGRIHVSAAYVVAFVEMLFQLAEIIYAPFYALFIVGPAALLVEAWWIARARRS